MKKIIIILALFITSINLVSAQRDITESDSIIFQAMGDELNRNMNELSIHDHPKPFFISYTVSDVDALIVRASNGALLTSNKNHNRSWSARVMVGDYKINDENYEGRNTQNEQEVGTLAIPLDDDYYGIRRALWLATNNVYKRAAAKYKDKMNVIETNNIRTDELIEDFSKEEPVKKYLSAEELKMDKSYFEKLAKELSEIFTDHSEIYSSSVTFGVINTNVYFVNSEGTEVKIPYNLFELKINATGRAENGQYVPAGISYHAVKNEQIPSKDFILGDISLLIDHVKQLTKAELMKDSYSGPVLIDGQAVPEMFVSKFLSGDNSLVAQRASMYSYMEMSVFNGESKNQLEKKIGKKVLSNGISIVANPFRTDFEGISLTGAFTIDAEGVTPPEELVLVEKGFLRTLFNDRTPTKHVKKSNGHNRLIARFGNVTKEVFPGVLEISAEETLNRDELKTRLTQMASDEGYDYAVILRSIKNGVHSYPKAFYKLNIETGEETLIRSVSHGANSFNLLRNVEGVSEDVQVNNMLSGGANAFGSSYMMYEGAGFLNGAPTSFITPGAILLKNYDLEGMTAPMTNMEPSVEPPVKER